MLETYAGVVEELRRVDREKQHWCAEDGGIEEGGNKELWFPFGAALHENTTAV